MSGGPSRNRTGVQGFAVLCVTTPPSGPGERAPFRELGVRGQAFRCAGPVDLSMNGGWRGGELPIRARLELQVYYRHITAMTVQSPIPDFAAARAAMVESQLRPQGVTDPAVLDAMGTIAARGVRARRGPAARLCRPRGSAGRRPLPSCAGGARASAHPDDAPSRASARSSLAPAPAIRPRSSRDGPRGRRRSKARPSSRAAPASIGIDIVEGPLEAGWHEGRALRPDPDRRRRRVYSRRDRRPARRWRPARHRAYRPRHHPPDRRPQVGRRIRISFARATPAFRLFRASPDRMHSLSKEGRPQWSASLSQGSLIAALMAGTAAADTLREALVSAYQTNPTLTAQRETLKATDATVAIAKAAGRPQVSGTVGLNRDLAAAAFSTPAARVRRSRSESTSATLCSTAEASITRSRPRRRASRRAARPCGRSKATSSPMRSRPTWTSSATASIVELNQNNVKVLETNLEATRDRFQIGDLTRTDVAQSEARLQLGRSQLADGAGPAGGERSDLSPGDRPRAGPAGPAAAASAAARRRR